MITGQKLISGDIPKKLYSSIYFESVAFVNDDTLPNNTLLVSIEIYNFNNLIDTMTIVKNSNTSYLMTIQNQVTNLFPIGFFSKFTFYIFKKYDNSKYFTWDNTNEQFISTYNNIISADSFKITKFI